MCVVLIVCEVDRPTCMQIEEKNREDSIFYSIESVRSYNKQLRELRAVCIVLKLLSLIKQFQRRGKLLYGTGNMRRGSVQGKKMIHLWNFRAGCRHHHFG